MGYYVTETKKKVFICARCAACCVQDQIQMALTLLNIAQFFLKPQNKNKKNLAHVTNISKTRR